MLQNGTLWTSHTIGVTDTGVASGSATRNGVRWYQLGSLTTPTPSVVQSGTLFTAGSPGNFNQRNYWVPLDCDFNERANGHRVQRRRRE